MDVKEVAAMADESVYGPYHGSKSALGVPGKAPDKPPQPRMGMRERLIRWSSPKPQSQGVLDPLLAVVLSQHPKADVALLQRAFDTADHLSLIHI